MQNHVLFVAEYQEKKGIYDLNLEYTHGSPFEGHSVARNQAEIVDVKLAESSHEFVDNASVHLGRNDVR